MSWHIPLLDRLAQGQTVRFVPRKGVASPPIPKGRQAVLTHVRHAEVKSGSPRERAKVGDVVLCRVRGLYWLHPVTAIRTVNGRQLYLIRSHKDRSPSVRGWVPLSQIYGKLHSTEETPT